MKRLIFVLAAAFAFYFASLWFTGQQYEQQLYQQLHKMKAQAPHIDTQLLVEQQDLFGRTEIYRISTDLPESGQTLTFEIRHQVQFQPFIIRGDFNLDWQQLFRQLLAEHDEVTLDKVTEDQGHWHASILSKQGEIHYQWDGMTILADGTIEILPLTSSGTMTLDLQHSAGSLDWQGMRMQGNDGEMEVGPIHYHGSAESRGDLQLFPELRMQIDRIYFSDLAGLEFHMGNFDWLTLSTTGATTSEVETRLSADTLQLHDATVDFMLELNQAHSDLVVANLNTEAYLGLLQLNSQDPQTQQEQALVLVDQLLADGLKLRLRDLSAQLVLQSPEENVNGTLHSSGDINLAQTSLEKLSTTFAPYLSAHLDIDISADMFAQHALGEVLEQLAEQGFFTRKGDKLVTEFEYVEGVMQLNQQPLPL